MYLCRSFAKNKNTNYEPLGDTKPLKQDVFSEKCMTSFRHWKLNKKKAPSHPSQSGGRRLSPRVGTDFMSVRKPYNGWNG